LYAGVETKPAEVYPTRMDKHETAKKEATDRRQDYARRLKIAVRRAHDPLFTLLKSPPEQARSAPQQ
jgi:hypothetical protein